MLTTPFTFRILAIRVLPGCKPWIRKCLQEGRMYYLCNTYNIKDVDGKDTYFTVKLNGGQNKVNDDFYFIPSGDGSQNDVRISISAIVGMNGDGKSTLIELIIRLINNFAQSHQFNPSAQLLHVEGVAAEMFYQYNDAIYRLVEKADDTSSELYRICKLDDNGCLQPQATPVNELQDDDEIRDKFFYTLVTNYSHYAYNTNDFQRERDGYPSSESSKQDNYWLHKVFHKNDGYQVPLSLHPYRDYGNIDINREASLSMQRLLSLFVSEDNPVDNPSSFRRLNGKDADFIELEDIGYSKFQERTLVEGLKNVRDEDLLSDVIDHLGALDKDTSLFQKEIDNTDSEIYNTLRGITNLLFHYSMKASLFNLTRDWINKRSDKANILPVESDISKLYDYLEQNHLDANFQIGRLLKKIRPFRIFNLAQIFRIHIIGTVCESFEEYSKQRFDKNFTMMLLKDYTKLTLVEKCEHYIIYKVISIFESYPQYIPIRQQLQSFLSEYHKKEKLSKGHTNSFSNKFNLDQLKKDCQEHTHITLKLRQAYKYMCALKESNAIYEKFHTGKDDKVITVNLDKLGQSNAADLHDLENMPPPIYSWDIIFIDNVTHEEIRMNQFSSGEKQRLNTLGAVIYHIRNIDSINSTDEKEIKYQAVNLIFEEVELYFHPEWQRQYIKSLIDAVRGMRLRKVKAINMIFATHSPFILSDIPKNNVLFLKRGKPDYSMQGNTFGANINSLLKNGFFMPTLPIGNFAHDKINYLFETLNKGIFKRDELDHTLSDIMQVGEPYLRSQLLKLYKDYDTVVDNDHLMSVIDKIVEQRLHQIQQGDN